MHQPGPNLFVVGAPKAGTTSLATWLGAHPDVYWCTPKEPFHFAADFPGQLEHYGFTSREAYLTLYQGDQAAAARYRGDGSTTYLYLVDAVPDILERDSDARCVVSVRDPLELLPSYHRTQLVALNEDRHDFAQAWRRTLAGHGPGLRPLDPFLVDDLYADSQRVWRSLCQALDLDPDGVPELVARLKSAVWSLAETPRLGHDIRAELADYFTDDVALLEQLLSRDLLHWASGERAG